MAVPRHAGTAEKILEVDPTSREAFAIDLPPGIRADEWWKILAQLHSKWPSGGSA